MIPMTPAEKETSRRVFEALGAGVCALLTWAFAALHIIKYNPAIWLNNWLLNLLFTFLLSGLAYGGAFWLLDVWWSNSTPAQHGLAARPNWAVIPFLAAWVVWGTLLLCFPLTLPDYSWLSYSLLATFGWGAVMCGVMFIFWFMGCVQRFFRG